MKTFLMIGQSNMAGRGRLDEAEPIDDPLCRTFRMAKFRKMNEPVNVDRSAALREFGLRYFSAWQTLAPRLP